MTYVQSGGTNIWNAGGTNTSDFGINRFVSGTATDYPVMVRGATGNVELGVGPNDVIVGKQSAGAAADTTEHLPIPFVAGAPTGVPASDGKGKAIRFDTTNHKLWVYDAGWKGVVLA